MDTSAWYSFLNEKDEVHEQVLEIISSKHYSLVTSNFIVAELLNLQVSRRMKHVALGFGRSLREKSDVIIVPVEPRDENEAWSLFEKYKDKDYSFTDCTSFALMKRIKGKKVLALDDDFREMGFLVLPEKS